MQTKRLILALLLSSAILFLWTYFTPKPPQNQNGQPGAAEASPSPSAQTANSASPSPSTAPATSTNPTTPTASSTAPKRVLTINTPLYQAKFDTLGAEPVSWIILKNKRTETPIHSSASTRKNKVDLQLISPKGLERQVAGLPTAA